MVILCCVHPKIKASAVFSRSLPRRDLAKWNETRHLPCTLLEENPNRVSESIKAWASPKSNLSTSMEGHPLENSTGEEISIANKAQILKVCEHGTVDGSEMFKQPPFGCIYNTL